MKRHILGNRTTPTDKQYRLFDAHAATLRVRLFEESGSTRLTIGLGGGSAAYNGVLARRTLGVGSAGIGLGATGRWLPFEESGRTRLALADLGG